MDKDIGNAPTCQALLVIDVQESFRQCDGWRAISNPAIVDDVNRLVTAARERGQIVIWVLHADPGSGTVFDPASGHVRLMDGLSPSPDEVVLTKSAHNAFTTTSLQLLLTRHGIRRVTICGIRTEQCCETTARLARDLGFDVVFVTEATATTPLPHRDLGEAAPLEQILTDPRTLPVGEVIARTEYALAGRFATIATIAEVTGAATAATVATAAVP
ncbi:MAG: isochorismatase family protein [Actinomycetales bacterium]|nr:isochorismatase family protein [Actinomycetales bacterium]